ncbi:MAG: YraN family protein [Thermoanaerobaculales bacterium]
MVRTSRQKLGRRAEWAALLLLLVKGYRLRDRNWRGAGGELDLVVQRRSEIVFVEVKARSSDLFGGAIAAVDLKKRRILIQTAAAYLSRHSLWESPCRFDVVTVERKRGLFPWRLQHFRDAFQPDLGRQF